MGDGERDIALVPGRNEVGRVAGSLEHLANGLRELDRERGLYVSQVSHDLRNPLAVIGTYASVLRRGERSRPRAAKLQTIEDEVSRLAVMVDDLLARAAPTRWRSTSSAHPPRCGWPCPTRSPAPVRARDAPASSCWRRRARSTPRRTPAACARRSTTCWTTPYGTRAPRRASSWPTSPRTCSPLGVADDGPGIDRELLPRLFDAFAQGAGRIGGSGMGLSTVRAVAEAHGGGVSVAAVREGGASFTLRLPLAPAGTTVRPAASARSRDCASTGWPRRAWRWR